MEFGKLSVLPVPYQILKVLLVSLCDSVDPSAMTRPWFFESCWGESSDICPRHCRDLAPAMMRLAEIRCPIVETSPWWPSSAVEISSETLVRSLFACVDASAQMAKQCLTLSSYCFILSRLAACSFEFLDLGLGRFCSQLSIFWRCLSILEGALEILSLHAVNVSAVASRAGENPPSLVLGAWYVSDGIEMFSLTVGWGRFICITTWAQMQRHCRVLSLSSCICYRSTAFSLKLSTLQRGGLYFIVNLLEVLF